MGEFDFSGWATRNDILCSDGRTIRQNAFADQDGITVPLVWNHKHDGPDNVLGHALLKNHPEGVRCFGKFNNTAQGQIAKECVDHGDIEGLSIWANGLKQVGGDVMHGVIREVSLVLAGANPGAYIDDIMEHSDGSDDAAIIYSGMNVESYRDEDSMEHSEESKEPEPIEHSEEQKKEPEEEKVADEQKKEKTVEDVFNELTEEQKQVVYAIIGQAIEDATNDDSDENEGEEEMKHNVFDNETSLAHGITPEDMKVVFADAKRCGSLKEAVEAHLEEGVLAHAVKDDEGNTVTYGMANIDYLFPEAKTLNNTPEFIKRNDDWVAKVMNGVHHSPFSRVKSIFADITMDEARAKGYTKGKQKTEEVFALLKRATEPQTIYKKQKLDRDDIIDITDFDVVSWLKSEMRMMLDEEIARAILIGDGRSSASNDKISDEHIRPIASDAALYTVKVPVAVEASADSETKAKAFIKAAIKARKDYKGSGNPTLFTTEDVLTDMLLIEDKMGHLLYPTEQVLATTLRVKEIVTVEPMEGQNVTFKVDDVTYTKPLMGLIVNLADYNVGADRGGAVSMFDDFDIDYNQQKYLIETRCSGAMVKPYGALTLYLEEAGE